MLGLGYIIGQFVPVEYLHPKLISTDINTNDYYTRLITIGGIISTLLAIIIALFKEDIRRLWEYSSLEIEIKYSDKILCEILDVNNSDESSDSTQNIKAIKYELPIVVKNTGKLPAKNCEIYIDKLEFKNSSFTYYQEIPSTGIALDWWGKNQKAILIPPSGKSQITIVEIFSNEVSTDDMGNALTKESLKIKFGNIDSPPKYKSGTWVAHFVIYSENTKPIKYIIELEWNGKWEQRLTEMTSKNIKIHRSQCI